MHGDLVELMLNEQLVFSRVLESTNLRTFGLFHYADQTEAGLGPHGDFDIALELDVIHMEPCDAGGESCVLLQTEFNDSLKSVSEIKYSIHSDGQRAAETQIRRARPDGSLAFDELQTTKATGATLLRLARRGAIIYQIFQASKQTKPEVLGAMIIGTDPVPDGFLRTLIHTSGANRKTIVQYKSLESLEVHADRIIR